MPPWENRLLGINAEVLEADGRPHRYNSTLLVGQDGGTHGCYDKIHRVPFGEYVPLRD
jgi:apolipoprotein N-acyltransferase